MKKISLIIILCMLTSLLISVNAYAEPSNIAAVPVAKDHGKLNYDIDTDKDGLSDYQEKYKYYTDPDNADSDGDGIPDGDWEERREYTYTIKATIQIAGSWDINAMNNYYQDARIIGTNDYTECEIVLYIENSMKEGIGRNSDWGKYGPEFNEYLKPYIYTNWDEKMREDLIKELKAYGIHPEVLSDKELVQRVSMWIRETTIPQEYNTPAQFYLKYDKNGRLFVDDRYRVEFDKEVKLGRALTDDEIFNTHVLGKQMYYNKTRGGCTSSATYAATIYRALGIPTRYILSIKLSAGVLNFIDNIKNPLVKQILIDTSKGRGGHQTNEVYIDGRWVRIDYDEFGAGNMYQERGLKYQMLTINDYSDIDMVASFADITYQNPFGNQDPYNLLDLSDNYGKYYKPRYSYGIDPNLYSKYMIFGEDEFSYKARKIILRDLQKYKVLERVEGVSRKISNIKEEYYNDNNIMIISADTAYHELPAKIRARINRNEYMNIGMDEYRTLEVGKAIVLLVKK